MMIRIRRNSWHKPWWALQVRGLRWPLALVAAACAGIAGSAALSTPVISTFAGGGAPASGNGDGGQATAARLTNPVDVAIDVAGNVYIADVAVFVGQDGFKVRRVDPAGVITTVAGNGALTYNGDGIAATSAAIAVAGIAVDGAGNLYIADKQNHRVRKVAPSGMISTVAGNGTAGFFGDQGQARNARISLPSDVATDEDGNLYIIDSGNVRIRKVDVNGVITTVAGNGQTAYSGDGGPATQASLYDPRGIAVDGAGNLYIAEHGSRRIRKVTTAGIISTIAGGGPFRSDPVAVNMRLVNPHGVAVDGRGNVYVAEYNNLVRVISPAGIIKVLAGQFNDTTFGNEGAQWGFAGDGGPADEALLYEPLNLALDAQDNVYIADSRNGRVRKVTPVTTPPTPGGVRAFHPFRMHQVGSFSKHVAVADVTGDGRTDALLTTASWSGPNVQPENDLRLWVFVQQPDGTLASPQKHAFFGDASGGRSGSGLVTADLDHDGFMDVMVGTLNGVAIFRGHPGGVHPAVVSEGLENAQIVNALTATDVDRDGHTDIVVLGCCRAEGGSSPFDRYGMTVHYGNGAGGIARKLFYPMEQNFGTNLNAIDMNRDGVPDLVKSWGGTQIGGVDIMLHNRVDGFQAPIRLSATSTTGMSGAYAIGDFDHDGLRDVIVSRNGNAPHASYVHFRQAPMGVFTQVRDWRTYDMPDELLGTDMNGDARDDLLVVHGAWESIGYQSQTDAGLDTEVKSYTVQSGNPMPPALAAGDLDGDGCKDAAMADYNYGLIVLRGANCVSLRNGSQPRVPRKPVTTSGPTMQGSDSEGAGFVGVRSQGASNPPAMPAYRRITHRLSVVWQRPFTHGERIAIAFGLLGLLGGAWWGLRVRR